MNDGIELGSFEEMEVDETFEQEINSTDELMVAGYVKEATKKGIPGWMIEEKVQKRNPEQVWIVPKILGIEKSVSTHKRHLVSGDLEPLEFLDSIKKPFLKWLRILLGIFLLAVGCYSLIRLVTL